MSMPLDPSDDPMRGEFVNRITAAIRPREVRTGEMRALTEALALVGAMVFLKRLGIPYTEAGSVAFARAAIDGMERQAALETN